MSSEKNSAYPFSEDDQLISMADDGPQPLHGQLSQIIHEFDQTQGATLGEGQSADVTDLADRRPSPAALEQLHRSSMATLDAYGISPEVTLSLARLAREIERMRHGEPGVDPAA